MAKSKIMLYALKMGAPHLNDKMRHRYPSIHKNVNQGIQTSPSLWLLCPSSSALTQHSNLLSYIDDTNNIQHAESTNYHHAHTHSQ